MNSRKVVNIVSQSHARCAMIAVIKQHGAAMIDRLFLDHPRSVNETYLQHAAFAGRFSLALFGAGVAALVHAVLPFAFERTASRTVAALYARTHNRGQ